MVTKSSPPSEDLPDEMLSVDFEMNLRWAPYYQGFLITSLLSFQGHLLFLYPKSTRQFVSFGTRLFVLPVILYLLEVPFQSSALKSIGFGKFSQLSWVKLPSTLIYWLVSAFGWSQWY